LRTGVGPEQISSHGVLTTIRIAKTERNGEIAGSIRLLGVIHFREGAYPTRDAEAKERELHNEFQHLCRFKAYSRGAEWFHASQDLLGLIEKSATKPEALKLPRHCSAASVDAKRA
jgi:hypothetical protein